MALEHLDGSLAKSVETRLNGLDGRVLAVETWRANKSAAIAKLAASPSVTGVTILGLVVPTKLSVDSLFAAVHGKINELIDLVHDRELTH